jgi:hypothetical protein
MEYNTTQKKQTQFNLPNTIKNITFYFIKQHYNKYLKERELEKIPKVEIALVVDQLYTDKEQELKKYIRGTMRKNFSDYDKNFTMKTTTEEIILEMFEDPDFSKNRLAIEIENYQEGKK